MTTGEETCHVVTQDEESVGQETHTTPDEWGSEELSRLVTFTRKPSSLQISSYDQIPFIPMESIADTGDSGFGYVAKSPTQLSSGTYCENGDVLLAKITPSFENGKQAIISDMPHGFAYATTEVFAFKPIPDKLDTAYIFHFFRQKRVRAEIAQKMEGTTGRQRVPKGVIATYPIPLPPLPEQRRIAAVLNAIQEAIAAQENVIAAARQVKRSLMQRLFTYGPGREPAPTKATEIGEIPAHWEVESVGKLADIRGGKRLPQGAIYADVVTEHPYIRVTDFIDNGVAGTGLKYLTDETFQEIKRFIITSDDVYISIAGTTGLVGVIPTELSGANLTENAARFVIRDKDRILNRFLAQWLSHDAGQNQIQTRTTKTSQPKLALMRIQEIPVAVPPKTEQSAIVESIEAADAKIAAEEDRKTALEALFKSMLHQLMTGQIRLLTDEGLPL